MFRRGIRAWGRRRTCFLIPTGNTSTGGSAAPRGGGSCAAMRSGRTTWGTLRCFRRARVIWARAFSPACGGNAARGDKENDKGGERQGRGRRGIINPPASLLFVRLRARGPSYLCASAH